MKTIREKSEEYQETALKEKGAILRIDVKNAFGAGANYVLDHLSKTIAVSRDGYLYDNLKKMIEQLKK